MMKDKDYLEPIEEEEDEDEEEVAPNPIDERLVAQKLEAIQELDLNKNAKQEAASKAEPAQGEAAEQEAATPELELAKAQMALAAEHDQYLRLAAEYDNFRKRSRKEKVTLYADVQAETVTRFLPVVDDLERALANETTDEAYKKGVEMIMAELEKILADLGVGSFGTVGDIFDPNFHNAVMHIENEELEENVITQVFQKGFVIGDRVIRHAVVQVAN